MKVFKVITLTGLLLSANIYSQHDDIEILDWEVDENTSTDECEVLDVQAVNLPDEDDTDDFGKIAIDFELDYETELESPDKKKKSRCAWKVDVQSPDGYRLRIGRLSIGGNVDIGKKSKATVTASYRVMGDASPVAKEKFKGKNKTQPFEMKSPFDKNSPWSECGGSFSIKGRTDVKITTKDKDDAEDSVIIQNAAGKHYYRYIADCEPCSIVKDTFSKWY